MELKYIEEEELRGVERCYVFTSNLLLCDERLEAKCLLPYNSNVCVCAMRLRVKSGATE